MWTTILPIVAVIGVTLAGLILAPTTVPGFIALGVVSVIVGSWSVLVGRELDD